VLPRDQRWFGWLFYQFMYVSVAEEVFFRGYLQGNILRLANIAGQGPVARREMVSIVLSAACFALAHAAVQGGIASVLTFVPGLILGWLFVRTKSLLAPILFHGLANISYCLMASAVAAS
jgi:membrane protease YdiL (CAAX protease family)